METVILEYQHTQISKANIAFVNSQEVSGHLALNHESSCRELSKDLFDDSNVDNKHNEILEILLCMAIGNDIWYGQMNKREKRPHTNLGHAILTNPLWEDGVQSAACQSSPKFALCGFCVIGNKKGIMQPYFLYHQSLRRF